VKNRITGLDTLRFFAFLSIFVFHATPYFKFGYLGVDFFFVLSSFLLTYLALAEINTQGKFNAGKFFIRRVLRIFPLYYFVIVISFVALPLLARHIGINPTLPHNKLLYWLLLSNYETSDCVFYLKFLWSIAVEEQFYLLFILFSFMFRKYLWWVILLLILVYFSFMTYATANSIATYSHTLTHFPNFAAGMAGGYLFYKNKQLHYYPLITLALSFITLFFFKTDIIVNLSTSVLFISLIFVFINALSKNNAPGILKITEFAGKYTYGLYVYSGIVLTFSKSLLTLNSTILTIITEFILLFALAFVSFHIYEKPFLRLKKRFRSF